MSEAVARGVSWVVVAALAAVVGVVIFLLVEAHDQTHANANVALAPLADHARVIARYDDCSDLTSVGYVKNNSCIDYLLIQTPDVEPATRLVAHEVAMLDHRNWRSFSPTDFGFYNRAVVGRTDLYGHDCLLLGPVNDVPFARFDRPLPANQPTEWRTLTQRYATARTRPGAIIGLQFYPGPVNDPYHRVC